MGESQLVNVSGMGTLVCCFRKCQVDDPRCSRGERCNGDKAYKERVEAAPKCPACHVVCSLFDPQCSRGIEFRERWQAGEEIPERRMPPRGKFSGEKPTDKSERAVTAHANRGEGKEEDKPRGPRGPHRGPKSTADKLMFLLTGVVPRMLGSLDGNAEQKILSGLARQGGAMNLDVIPEKARVEEPSVAPAIETLVSEGLIEPRQSAWGTTYYWITEPGEARCKEHEAQRDRAVKERFSTLSDEEQEELASLLDKLLAANRRPR